MPKTSEEPLSSRQLQVFKDHLRKALSDGSQAVGGSQRLSEAERGGIATAMAGSSTTPAGIAIANANVIVEIIKGIIASLIAAGIIEAATNDEDEGGDEDDIEAQGDLKLIGIQQIKDCNSPPTPKIIEASFEKSKTVERTLPGDISAQAAEFLSGLIGDGALSGLTDSLPDLVDATITVVTRELEQKEDAVKGELEKEAKAKAEEILFKQLQEIQCTNNCKRNVVIQEATTTEAATCSITTDRDPGEFYKVIKATLKCSITVRCEGEVSCENQ